MPVKKLLLIILVVLLPACTALVSKQIQHPEIIDIDIPGTRQGLAELTHRWCPDDGKSCLDYIDIPAAAELVQFGKIQISVLDITIDGMQEKLDLSTNANWTEKDLVLVLFPGFAASKKSVMMYALWFHSLGYRVIVVPGPNEAENFNFGLTTARDTQRLLQQQSPSDSGFVAVGFSMGIIAATAFSQAEPRVVGTIGLAPMQRFDLAMMAYEKYFEKKWWSWLITDKKLTAALEQTLEQANMSLAATDVRTQFTKPTLLLASESDQMAPYQYYYGLDNPCVELIELENFQHMQIVSFPWEPIRQPIEHWLESITEHACSQVTDRDN